jgi:hypothetical protein
MKSKKKKSELETPAKNLLWIAAWLFLVIISLDFYNWGKTPYLIFGIPLWLWAQTGLVFFIALVFGVLAHFTWDEEPGIEKRKDAFSQPPAHKIEKVKGKVEADVRRGAATRGEGLE